ncbi:MAG: YraN family protein [Aquificota bacterium]|nr:YraN family protein [Aquificota bacterium]
MRRGKVYEDIAEEYLKSIGYRILGRNVRCGRGEVDIVALDGNTLVLVEVKGGRTEEFGHPAERFSEEKLRRLISCGYEISGGRPFRVDLIVVFGEEVDHIKNVGFF